MTHDVLDEIGYHFVKLADVTNAEWVAVVITGIHNDACKAVERHNEHETETEQHQRSTGGSH